MSVNKLERLLNLTAVLLDTPRPLAAEELRQKVDGYPPPGAAFHRTFERDKEDLRVLGIPLRVERVPAADPPMDGYRIAADDYYLPDPGLAPDELAALHLATLTVRMEGTDQEAIWKLGGFGADDPTQTLAQSDPGVVKDVVANLPSDPALVPIFQAISEKRTIGFTYRDQDRLVEPWRLDFHRGRWYLTGYDRAREGERNFRLDRIEGSVEQTGLKAEVEPPAAPTSEGPRAAWEMGEEEQVIARLLVDQSRVETASRQLGPAVEREVQADGSIIYIVPVVKYDAFRSFVLGFLHHAELLEPPEWRADVVSWLTALAESDVNV